MVHGLNGVHALSLVDPEDPENARENATDQINAMDLWLTQMFAQTQKDALGHGLNGQDVLQRVAMESVRAKGTVMEELIVRDHVRKGKTVQDVLVNGLNGVNAL